MKSIRKSTKLDNVCYDIRGPILECAHRMEEEGHKVIKLNIGNLAVFGFDAPEEIQQDMIRNLPNSAGYSDSKGIFAARKAVMHYTQQQGVKGVALDDIYLGNGASELIVMASNAIMTTAFARVGFSGDYGGTYFLTQLVGSAKAREMYFLSDRVSADEALRLGLTNWVCAPEELAAKAHEIALRLANGPTVAYRYMKENLNRAMAGEVDECLDLEATHHVHCGQTEDHREATQAFVAKREPVFKGC